jgi:hypothetical protein
VTLISYHIKGDYFKNTIWMHFLLFKKMYSSLKHLKKPDICFGSSLSHLQGFMSLKLHIFTNVYSLVHFVSTIFVTFTVIDVHSYFVFVELINWYFRRCYCTYAWYCIFLFCGVYSYAVCCTWLCVSLIRAVLVT